MDLPTSGHVLDACAEAKLDADPPQRWAGTQVAYESTSGSDLITYESAVGPTWTCHYDPFSGDAFVTGLE